MEKKNLLKEELDRFNSILEYTFYVGEEGDEASGDVDKLLLGGDLEEQEEEVTDVVEPTDEVPVEEPVVDDPFATGEVDTDIPVEDPALATDPFGGDMPVEDEFAEEPVMDDMSVEEPMEDQIEVDVTDIVTKAEEAKEETSQVNSKVDDLLGKFSELEDKLGAMDGIISKIDELETEVIKRNPTPTEQLHMRSLDSFPYTVKLTDFWDDKEGYDAAGEEEPEEYTLTNDEVEYDYSETDVKNSFRIDK